MRALRNREVAVVVSEEIQGWYRDGQVTITTGAASRMSHWELQGLIAHERGHHAHYHDRWLQVAAAVAFGLVGIAPWVVEIEHAIAVSVATIASFYLFKLLLEVNADQYAARATSRWNVWNMLQVIRANRVWSLQLEVRLWIVK